MEQQKESETRKKAVALRYDMERDQAPVVVAKGYGLLAERIAELARESGVAVKEDRQLAEYLMSLDLYEEIPPELYPIVAEILAFIYAMERRFPKGG
jgi:flagellar biosynthesis protein